MIVLALVLFLALPLSMLFLVDHLKTKAEIRAEARADRAEVRAELKELRKLKEEIKAAREAQKGSE